MSKPRIIGQLVIVAYKARYLPEREVVGKQDPFVIFRIGETIERTKTDYRGGQRPTWDDQVILPIPEKKTKVVCQVYDEDGKRQELISETELDISKVLSEGEQDGWFPLSYKGRSAGEIYLELTFYAARPPPKRQPTRFGMSKPYKPAGGYVPATVPQQQTRPYLSSPQYPPQPTNNRPPPPPVPVESHSTPVHQQQQYRPPQQFHPAYPPRPNPTPSMSTGSQHSYPPVPVPNNSTSTNSRPMSYGGYPPPPSSVTNSSLLSSSYNPNVNPRPQNGMPGGFNSGYPPMSNHNGAYPPPQQTSPNMPGNRNSYPLYNDHVPAGPYPPSQQQQYNMNKHAFPEPQHMPTGGYVPHADPVMGTPFAAHQGSSMPPPTPTTAPNHQGYPPVHPQSAGYPPY